MRRLLRAEPTQVSQGERHGLLSNYFVRGSFNYRPSPPASFFLAFLRSLLPGKLPESFLVARRGRCSAGTLDIVGRARWSHLSSADAGKRSTSLRAGQVFLRLAFGRLLLQHLLIDFQERLIIFLADLGVPEN